ncbi:hypothetical protein MSG28_016003 [Choristoneura fumiferana]|uniref:Uncharacterized protein n=1 Tax=Choristoneura fumiferana TaxID=7141 RepID=A0ACC0K4Z2_CHOFU|nr:hypothetical protein MSG28_016003 [Choristoneura fumiferana]
MIIRFSIFYLFMMQAIPLARSLSTLRARPLRNLGARSPFGARLRCAAACCAACTLIAAAWALGLFVYWEVVL